MRLSDDGRILSLPGPRLSCPLDLIPIDQYERDCRSTPPSDPTLTSVIEARWSTAPLLEPGPYQMAGPLGD